ncbi:Guanylate kinase [Nymphon striatum]|nr:Guanylate kinase [Nymphon striatum]
MSTGTLYIISAPSGAGKTSLITKLLENLKGAEMAVSHTTRKAREGEVDGKHYHFIDADTFLNGVHNGDFLEHANVFGNHYGTSKKSVSDILDKGIDVILEIDWQGAQQVRELMPDALSIFILPPSKAELEKRLRGRGTDKEEVIKGRLEQSCADMKHYAEFDYIVINDDFDTAKKDLQSIFEANRITLSKQQERNQSLLEELTNLENNSKRIGAQNFVKNSAIFQEGLSTLNEFGNQFHAHKTFHADIHGDLNLGNIILGDSYVTGIDIGATISAPIENDIAQMLNYISINYFNMLTRIDMRKPFKEWEILNVVLDSYGYSTDEKSRNFFIYVFLYQVLRRWLSVQDIHKPNRDHAAKFKMLGRWRLHNSSALVQGLTKSINERFLTTENHL